MNIYQLQLLGLKLLEPMVISAKQLGTLPACHFDRRGREEQKAPGKNRSNVLPKRRAPQRFEHLHPSGGGADDIEKEAEGARVLRFIVMAVKK